MQNRYIFPHRVIHWAIALLVFGLLAVGILFWSLGHEGIQKLLGDTLTNMLYTYHKAFGIVVLCLALIGLGFRLLFGAPDYNPKLGWLWRLPSRWVHGLIYICILTLPIVGWLGSNAAGHPVQVFKYTLPTLIGEDKLLAGQIFWLHGLIAVTLVCLIAIHVLASFLHTKILRDNIAERMRLL